MILCLLWAKGNDKSPITRCKSSFQIYSKRYCINDDADLPAPIIKIILISYIIITQMYVIVVFITNALLKLHSFSTKEKIS
jgi:hypothetical protein